jgi:hypothetical protein
MAVDWPPCFYILLTLESLFNVNIDRIMNQVMGMIGFDGGG